MFGMSKRALWSALFGLFAGAASLPAVAQQALPAVTPDDPKALIAPELRPYVGSRATTTFNETIVKMMRAAAQPANDNLPKGVVARGR